MNVEFSEVLQLILQFFTENNFKQSFKALIEESGLTFNYLADPELLQSDIMSGSWQAVLGATSHFRYDSEQEIVEIHCAIISDLIAQNKIEVAKFMISSLIKKHEFDTKYQQKYERINSLLTAQHHHFLKQSGQSDHSSFQKQSRAEFCRLLLSKARVFESGLLLKHLGKSLLFTQSQAKSAKLPQKASLLSTKLISFCDPEDGPLDKVVKVIAFRTENAHPTALDHSGKENLVAVGSSDGLIEIFDAINFGLSDKAVYQREGFYLRHAKFITALRFDSKALSICSICADFVMKVWDVSQGRLLRKIQMSSSSASVSLVEFARNGECLAIFAEMIKIWGLNSCKKIAEVQTGLQLLVKKCCRISEEDVFAITDKETSSVKIVDLKINCLIKSLEVGAKVKDLAFANCLVVLTENELLKLSEHKLIPFSKVSAPIVKAANFICASPKGNILYLTGNKIDRVVSVSAQTQEILFEFFFSQAGENSNVINCVASCCKNMICVLNSEGKLIVFGNSLFF